MADQAQEWYVAVNGEAAGPYSGREIEQMHRFGTISSGTQILRVGSQEWVPFEPAEFAFEKPAASRVELLNKSRGRFLPLIIACVLLAVALGGWAGYRTFFQHQKQGGSESSASALNLQGDDAMVFAAFNTALESALRDCDKFLASYPRGTPIDGDPIAEMMRNALRSDSDDVSKEIDDLKQQFGDRLDPQFLAALEKCKNGMRIAGSNAQDQKIIISRLQMDIKALGEQAISPGADLR